MRATKAMQATEELCFESIDRPQDIDQILTRAAGCSSQPTRLPATAVYFVFIAATVAVPR